MNYTHYLQHFDNITSFPAKQKFKNKFSIGDYIKIGFLFKEGEKKRIQFFEGIVLAINGPHFDKKITLRKPGNYAVERIFSLNSPQIQTLKILQSQKFCRAKLYYLRKLVGKAAFGFKEKKKNN
uniref:Ribosomal protein L19 n=1 Tax=Pseudochlorodesmis sp. HV01306c TaxID=2358490 RepID=A0A386AYH5_9CHLO|nr:ribosomal protein L19 [Pseudochlorodesmis sp. HV01306c]